MGLNTSSLPDFPWDSLTPFIERASAHPDGIVNLSVGTPADPTPLVVREALTRAADAPGYPATHGTPALREAVAQWFARRRGVPDVDPAGVMPTIGSKELVAFLPALLGLGVGDVVVHPSAAYPTYDVGARLAGATPFPCDDVAEWEDNRAVKLVWVNSPSNPTGTVMGAAELRATVEAARAIGAVVASDACYAELPWEEPWVSDGVPSLLDPVVAALTDDAHVAAQREVYRARRELLSAALRDAGFTIDGSAAGLYLWCTRGEDCWQTISWLADRGIVAAPGAFYGQAGTQHVRVALTASDERIASAARRLVKEQ